MMSVEGADLSFANRRDASLLRFGLIEGSVDVTLHHRRRR
jgi:hypothetical protein